MENRVGSAGGSVEFEYKVESSEAGKWYQGKMPDVLFSDVLFSNAHFRADLFFFFRFRIFITPFESKGQDTTDSKDYIYFLRQ